MRIENRLRYIGETGYKKIHVLQKRTGLLETYDTMSIRVCKNDPYIVSEGIPLQIKEIRNDSEGYCSSWHEVTTFPLQEQYSLCRCGHSKNKPFCDCTHAKIHFDGTETADDKPYLERAGKITGPTLFTD